ncbi:MAG: aspartate aminotransferase family protein [Bacteroidales bacterium]|nr:aspartate aminotransferase family protein [Bacteroidales bacterium]
MTDRELFYRHLGLPSFTPMALDIVHAEGVWLTDRDGNRFLDLVSGISVSNIGHRHPMVLSAIDEQLDKYLYLNVYGEFIQSPQVKLAKRLTDLLPPSLDSVYFVNSGSEAIEGAMKLAKRYTGRQEIIAFKDAYHGSTQGALSILGNEMMKSAFRPLIPDIRHLKFNHFDDLDKITEKTACVVAETIQAEAGLILPEANFLQRLRERCAETGTLLVIDDVQMGFGRTGSLFSFEQYGFVPDVLVLAKALGAGMPLGAFIAPKQVMDSLAFNPELGHITTFGGHPVSCAAALAGIEVLLADGLLSEVEEKGRQFEEKVCKHPAIASYRRRGLAIGLDMVDHDKRQPFMEAALNHGIIIDWYLFKPATFRIAPPLTITKEEIEEACSRLIEVLDYVN